MKKLKLLNFKLQFLILFFFLNTLLLAQAQAEGVSIEFSNGKPVVGETFSAIFHIESDADVEPKISLDPVNLVVLSQSFQGVSSSTIYMNGKLTSKKEMIVSLELAPKNEGRAGLTNIQVDVGGKILKHDSEWLNVYKEPQEVPKLLLLAIPSKTRVYQGESILVRYYLYNRVDITSFDIKEFPKLNSFTKRYLQEQGTRERVNYQGDVYIRQLLYSAVVFPDKVEKLKIDSMKVSVTYAVGESRDFFGFGAPEKTSSRLLISAPVDIEVLKLPGDTMPTGFTGLVGKHSFSLEINKNKFLVNEPIEIKLKVSGPGNLEGMDPPPLIKDPSFEDFENNSDFEINNVTTATKTFNYTYLPRKGAQIPAQKIPLTIFNPETHSYENTEVNLPPITVAESTNVGTTSSGENLDEQYNAQNKNAAGENKNEETHHDALHTESPRIDIPVFAGPLMTPYPDKFNVMRVLNLSLMLIIFIIALLDITAIKIIPDRKLNYFQQWLKDRDKKVMSYDDLQKLFHHFRLAHSGFTIRQKVDLLDLSAEDKKYLMKLLDELESPFKTDVGAKNNNQDKKSITLSKTSFERIIKKLQEAETKASEFNSTDFNATV